MIRMSCAVLALWVAGCTNGAPELSAARGRLILDVAPLNLPGVSGACYDLQVTAGTDIVWSAGNPTQSGADDPDNLCSMQYGAPGGGLTFVGTCDASQPNNAVRLYVDSLWATQGGNTVLLNDWVNPCKWPDGCVLPATCVENTDTLVNFNLTVMRKAQQGFFDIGVNFSDVFCSAKLDCTYDTAGTDPIELLFNPATGQRDQTAVLGLACTAGPGQTTEIQASDVVVTCGSNTAVQFDFSDNSFCIQDTSNNQPVVYGESSFVSTFGTSPVVDLAGSALPGANGQFTFGELSVSESTSDVFVPAQVVGTTSGTSPRDVMLAHRVVFDAKSFSLDPANPFASIDSAVAASSLVTLERGTNGSWSLDQSLALPSGVTKLSFESFDAGSRAVLARATTSVSEATRSRAPLYLYRRTADVTDISGTTHFRYASPLALSLPSGKACRLSLQKGLVVGTCGTAASNGKLEDASAYLADLSASVPVLTALGIPSGSIPSGFSLVSSGFDDYGVRAADADHVLFGAYFRLQETLTSKIYVARRLVVATRPAPGSSWSTAFFSDGTQPPIEESWLGAIVPATNAVDPGLANTDNGIFFGEARRMVGGAMQSQRFVATFVGSTPHIWSNVAVSAGSGITNVPFYANPLGAWPYGGGYLALATLNTGETQADARTHLVYLSTDSATGVSVASFAGMDYFELPALRTITNGVQVFLNGKSGAATVEITGSGSVGGIPTVSMTAPTALTLSSNAGGFGSTALPKITSDPTFSLDVVDNALVTSPCSFLPVSIQSEPTTNQGSLFYQSKSFIIAAQIGNASVISIAPPNPAASQGGGGQSGQRMQVSDSFASFCVNTSGSAEVFGRSLNVDVSMSTGGTNASLYQVKSPRWTKNGGNWSFGTLSVANLASPFEHVFMNHPLGGFSGKLRAVGSATYVDVNHFIGNLGPVGAIQTLNPIVVERDAQGTWSQVQVLSRPAGKTHLDVNEVDPVTKTIVTSELSSVMNQTYSDKIYLYVGNGSAYGNPAYGNPIEVKNPLAAGSSSSLSCITVDANYGLLLLRCYDPTGYTDGNVEPGWKPAVVRLQDLSPTATEITATPLTTPTIGADSARFEDGVVVALLDATHIVADPRFGNATVGGDQRQPFRQMVVYEFSSGSWNAQFLDPSPSAGAYMFSQEQANGFMTGHMRDSLAASTVQNPVTETGFFATYEGTLKTWQSGLTYDSPKPASVTSEPFQRPTFAWRVGTNQRLALVHQMFWSDTTDSNSNRIPYLFLVSLPDSLGAATELGRITLPSVMQSPEVVGFEKVSDSATQAIFKLVLLQSSSNGSPSKVAVLPVTVNLSSGAVSSASFGSLGYLSASTETFEPRDSTFTIELGDDVLNPYGCDLLIARKDTNNATSGGVMQGLTELFDFPTSGFTGDTAATGTKLPRDPDANFSSPSLGAIQVSSMGSITRYTLEPNIGPGNAWSSDPDANDAIWQYATYIGNEALVCNGQPCNKRYWNVAIGFDPNALNCSVEFMATAGTSADFSGGVPTINGSWPVIHYQAQLTGSNADNNLVCKQNPLDANGSHVQTSYVAANQLKFCYRFNGTMASGKPVITTQPNCQTVFPTF